MRISLILPLNKIVRILGCCQHNMIVFYHQFLGLNWHHSFHDFMHELAIFHLFINFLIEPFVFKHFGNILKTYSREGKGSLYPFGIFRNLTSLFSNFKVDFSNFRSKMAVEVLGFSELIISTSIHHDPPFQGFFVALPGLFAIVPRIGEICP